MNNMIGHPVRMARLEPHVAHLIDVVNHNNFLEGSHGNLRRKEIEPTNLLNDGSDGTKLLESERFLVFWC